MGRRKSKPSGDSTAKPSTNSPRTPAKHADRQTTDDDHPPSGRSKLFWLLLLVLLPPLAFFGVKFAVARHWGNQAVRALQARQFDSADQLFENAASWSSSGGAYLLGRARVARLQEDPERTLERLDQAYMAGADEDGLRREKLLLSIQSGRAFEMLSQFQRLRDAQADDTDAVYEAYVVGFDAAGDPTSASDMVKRWLASQPESALAYMHAAHLAYDREELALAESSYRDALRRQPRLLDAQLGLARVYALTNNGRAALHHARAVLALDPEHQDAQLLEAKSLLGLRRMDEASDAYERVLQNHSDSFSARFELASLYSQNDRPERVIELLEPTLNEFPEDAAVNYLMASAHQQLGNSEAAEPYLQRHLDARAGLDQLTELELKTKPELRDFAFCKRLGTTYLKYQWESADHWLSQAVSMNPADPELLRAMGDLARKRGDTESAGQFHQAAEMVRQRMGR